MEELEFLQEGEYSENKPTVWLSVHPAERFVYTERLVREISSVIDCNIMLCTSHSDRFSPETLKRLRALDIRLIVVCATKKYILWRASGFSRDVPTAKELDIPILPLLKDEGITNLYNTRLGDLHCIDDFGETDDLRAALRKMLYGKRKVQDETVPTAFISYRKCDSPLLHRLLNKIQPEADRLGVRLWYDASLELGKNYSYEIDEKLSSSSLFILIVTPRIIESNNYVIRAEYPEAKRLKKRIVPIELEPTDRRALSAAFPDIPQVLTANQTEALIRNLRDMKKGVKL